MAKKIRFPLEMKDGAEVRTLEELRDNFSLEQVMIYFNNKKLITWLRDRYIDDIADALEELEANDGALARKLCEIFEVNYDESMELDMEKAEERNRKLALLKNYTDDKEYYAHLDNMAFEQDDIYDLLDEGVETIYLCGEKFSIPVSKNGIAYIGVNNPTAVISSKEIIDFDAKGISFDNVKFDEKYQELLGAKSAEEHKDEKTQFTGVFGDYVSNTYVNFLLSDKQLEESKKMYELISKEAGSLNYDIDTDISYLRKKLEDADIAGMAESYIDTL